jgi:hypothetical protein
VSGSRLTKKSGPRLTKARLEGLRVACNVAMAAFDAAPDGSGDVSKDDARKIRSALAWLRAQVAAKGAAA